MLIFPRLNTQRLILRKIEVDDFTALVRHANNPKIAQWILNIPHPYHEPDAAFRMRYVVQGFKDKLRYVFAIILAESDELIGEISLHLDHKERAQLGYWIGESYWQQGFATEAGKAILNFGFRTLALTSIYATCHLDNPASGQVATKLGLQAGSTNGDVTLFQISSSEWLANQPD